MAAWIQTDGTRPLSVLDPGAGIGLLSAALVHRLGHAHVTAYEIEPEFQAGLRQTLRQLSGEHTVLQKDFIKHAVELSATGQVPGYDIAILNPPYKKIPSSSPYRALVSKLGVETTNLYACFLVCAIALCRPAAQVVAIVPRSFMNGPYFKPFRYWLLGQAAITHIHVFDRRDTAFADDGVLQENVILRLVTKAPQGNVMVSSSSGPTFSDVIQRNVPFDQIVSPDDADQFIHVPLCETVTLTGQSLRQLGLDVCTGPVVDFRLSKHLRQQPEAGCAPLLYSTHFAGGFFEWPRVSRKPNAIQVNEQTSSWLMKRGCYVVLRRFTSKEEKRRVVAYLLEPNALAGDWIGFENHLNVIHQNRQGLEPTLARGLMRYLNSQPVDDYFRSFSGHTQVNATDLRRLNYPSVSELRALGVPA